MFDSILNMPLSMMAIKSTVTASLQGFAALESLFYNKVSQIKVQGQQCTAYLRHLSC